MPISYEGKTVISSFFEPPCCRGDPRDSRIVQLIGI